MSTPSGEHECKPWMRQVLALAGVYNLVWGATVIVAPATTLAWLGLDNATYPQIWQCVGMIVGVYGVGYLIASGNPLRHWPITLVGLLGKIFGPLGFLSGVISGELPWSMGYTIITNDLIWWIPFVGILLAAIRAHNNSSAESAASLRDVIDGVRSHRGLTMRQLSRRGPVLLVFLRHSGCTFCRQSLGLLAEQRSKIEQRGMQLAIVHMSDLMGATQLLNQYDLGDVHRFSDPNCDVYRAFGLQRGSIWQLLGPKVLWLGFRALLIEGYGIGPMVGDGFRLPGAFVLHQGQVVAAYRAAHSADNPDYAELVERMTLPITAGEMKFNQNSLQSAS